MDEFGVLVESIGFRAHGKSAPMAKPKSRSNVNASPFGNSYSLPVDELDGIFRSSVNITKARQSEDVLLDDDIFGGPVSSADQYGGVDLESLFSSSINNINSNSNLDSRNSAGSNGYDDLFRSKSAQKDPIDDLFGSFGLNADSNQTKNGYGLDNLIPGFGGANQSKDRISSKDSLLHAPSRAARFLEYSEKKSNVRPSNSSSTGTDDPFLIFESYVTHSQSDTSWLTNEPSRQDTRKKSVQSSTNGFNGFFMAGPPRSGSKVGVRTAGEKASPNYFENGDYVEAIFWGNDAGQRNNARPSSMAQNTLFDGFFHEEERVVKQTSSHSFSTKKPSSTTSIGNDFTSLFGDVAISSGEFHEINGEPAERRRARLQRYTKMNKRMAEALAEKNQRDLQVQREQEEKRKLSETLDIDIKRWAAGKEGNLRALLCSLQQVLGPESGWRPVSLTDLIASESVKKVYKKATLYVHPDKVQQRRADLHQKYIAEKVFDILKEASNKFSAQELR